MKGKHGGHWLRHSSEAVLCVPFEIYSLSFLSFFLSYFSFFFSPHRIVHVCAQYRARIVRKKVSIENIRNKRGPPSSAPFIGLLLVAGEGKKSSACIYTYFRLLGNALSRSIRAARSTCFSEKFHDLTDTRVGGSLYYLRSLQEIRDVLSLLFRSSIYTN